MGLLFKRQGSGKETIFNKRIAASAISGKFIKGVVKQSRSKFALGKSGTGKRLEKDFMKAQQGGLERQEVHEIIQNRVAAGDITKEKAKEIAAQWGLTEDRFRKFKSMSECKDMKRKQERTERIKKERERAYSSQTNNRTAPKEFSQKPLSSRVSDTPMLFKDTPAANNSPAQKNQEKPKSVWEILNKQKHP